MRAVFFPDNEHRDDRRLGARGEDDRTGGGRGLLPEKIDEHPAVATKILVQRNKQYFPVRQSLKDVHHAFPARDGVNRAHPALTPAPEQIFLQRFIARRTDDGGGFTTLTRATK